MNNIQRADNETLEQYYCRLREKSDREDLVMFVNVCFASTRQNEFYNDRYCQSVSVEFLHNYILANYRRVYSRVLAAGINHLNQTMIILNLLRAGAPTNFEERREEGLLIQQTLRRLPANRAYSLLKSIKHRRINNRRSRAIIKDYLKWRQDPEFDAIKYRNKFRSAASHAHVKLDEDLGKFLFDFKSQKRFDHQLLDTYRQARYSQSAIYDLPFTIAQSLIERHNIPPKTFFKKIEPKMTAAEKLRFQTAASKSKHTSVKFDLATAPLTKLVLYILSLPEQEKIERGEEFEQALLIAAGRTNARTSLNLGRVAAILDHSQSSRGSQQKRNRPLAIAIAVHYLLRQATALSRYQDDYLPIWTPQDKPLPFGFLRQPFGQTSLAEPLIDALAWNPDQILIVSDGYENDPPMAAGQIADVYHRRLGGKKSPEIIHVNPVFDAEHFAPRPISKSIATVGLRDAEDLATMLGFARFASGQSTLEELHAYLRDRSRTMLGSQAK